jgi:phosphate starvation-inducible PhoH-like protein
LPADALDVLGFHFPSRRDAPIKDSPFTFHFEPRNAAQREFVKLCAAHDIVFALGPAGCGKTFLALACALADVRDGKRQKVVLIRPSVEAGEKLGYLPGTVEEKPEPYLAPFHQVLGHLAHKLPKKLLEAHAVAHLRGLTFEDAVVCVDEAQNLTRSQLKLVLTRLGSNAQLILCGDPEQSDIRPSVPGFSCDLDWVAEHLADCPGVLVYDFGDADVVRHPLIAEVLRRL